MSVRSLHSDRSAPQQVLGVYACPECGAERRLPISIRPSQSATGDDLASLGAA